MTNILVMCIEPIPSAILGVYEPLLALSKHRELQIKFIKTIDIRKADLEWCDTVIFIRSTEELELRIAKACKSSGKYLVYYLDDDLLNLPDLVNDARYYRDKTLQKNLIKIIETCNALWAVNPKIKEKYGKYTVKSVVTKGPAMLLNSGPMPAKNESPLVIGFAGSRDHAITLDAVAGEALKKISTEYGDKVRFEFLGAKPKIIDELDKSRYFPYIFDGAEYRKFMYNSNWSIGLAPLPCEDFFKRKYYNKFLEYGAIGCAGVYTDTEPFRYIVDDCVNGILCRNTPDDWYNALKKLIDDSELRKAIATNARKLLEDGYTELSVGYEAIKAIPEIAEFASPTGKVRIFGLSPIQNQLLLWYNKALRLIKKYWFFSIFIIAFLAIKKVLRLTKIIKGW